MAMSKNIEIDLSSEHVQREMGNAVRRFFWNTELPLSIGSMP